MDVKLFKKMMNPMITISSSGRQSKWSRHVTQRCTVPGDEVIGFNEPAEVNDGKVFGLAAAALWAFEQLSNWKWIMQ